MVRFARHGERAGRGPGALDAVPGDARVGAGDEAARRAERCDGHGAGQGVANHAVVVGAEAEARPTGRVVAVVGQGVARGEGLSAPDRTGSGTSTPSASGPARRAR